MRRCGFCTGCGLLSTCHASMTIWSGAYGCDRVKRQLLPISAPQLAATLTRILSIDFPYPVDDRLPLGSTPQPPIRIQFLCGDFEFYFREVCSPNPRNAPFATSPNKGPAEATKQPQVAQLCSGWPKERVGDFLHAHCTTAQLPKSPHAGDD